MKADQDLLSIRFKIDDCAIYAVRSQHDLELIHHDKITLGAWASLNGGKEFSLAPKRHSRLKVITRMPKLDARETYIVWRKLNFGWGCVKSAYPLLPQKLVAHWTYKETFECGYPHLASLTYCGKGIILIGSHTTVQEKVVVISQGMSAQEHFNQMLPEKAFQV